MEPLAVTEDERVALKELERQFNTHPDEALSFLRSAAGDRDVPEALVELVGRVLANLVDGQGVVVVPIARELTTHEAADLLGVSRTHLIQNVLGTGPGKLRYHRVEGTGGHRRIRLDDLLAYKHERDEARFAALGAMADRSAELGLPN